LGFAAQPLFTHKIINIIYCIFWLLFVMGIGTATAKTVLGFGLLWGYSPYMIPLTIDGYCHDK
jgi:hypothetical protein